MNALPLWAVALVVIGGTVVVAVAGFFCVLRFAGRVRDRVFNEVVISTFGVVQALFGLTMALVIFSLFQNYRATETGVRSEVTALAQFVRMTDAFPRPVKRHLDQQVTTYIVETVRHEWALLPKGESSPVAWGAIGSMYRTLQQYEPMTTSQQTFYGQAVGTLDKVVDYRRDVLSASAEAIPLVVQILLLVAAFVTLTATALMQGLSTRFQAVKLAVVAAVIGTALFSAVVLDSPFSNAKSISNTPFDYGALKELAE
jgi:hypothetical protein